MSRLRLAMLLAGLCFAATAEAGHPVTLLVHGLKVDLQSTTNVWSGMIGHLERSGHRYGGAIRMRGATLQLPEDLDRAQASGDPRSASLFALEFSDGANVDGLAYKTLELAKCLAEIRRLTGCQRVNLVAHSAGGLVARAYLQSALPGIPYAGDVDRLITVSTPHLGSALAEHLGDFLGTRATAIKPGGELIRRLNDDLELPREVLLASIVVRGVSTGIAALDFPSTAYDAHLDHDVLATLPLDYRRGGDQVVDVRSQNLRLARTASRYEAATGKPVLYLLARVPDPSPADRSLGDRSVHEAATSDPWTCLWVQMLLQDHRRFWSELDAPLMQRWVELQASVSAFGIIEGYAARRHVLSEVTNAKVDQLTLARQRDSTWLFSFSGRAESRPKLLRSTQTTTVSGAMELKFDRFGRITAERHALD